MPDVVSRCPVCGARVYQPVGHPTPPHRFEDENGKLEDRQCPGTGQPSN